MCQGGTKNVPFPRFSISEYTIPGFACVAYSTLYILFIGQVTFNLGLRLSIYMLVIVI